MPWKALSNGDGTWRVVNAETGKVHAKRTTHRKALIQIAIMTRAAEKKGE